VDVAQDVIIRNDDCGTTGFVEHNMLLDEIWEGGTPRYNPQAMGRMLVEPIVDKDGEVLADKGEEFTEIVARQIVAGLRKGTKTPVVKLRSVLYCLTPRGVCQQCYGRSLADGRGAELGDVVGIIAAQSIGEPGTQLTMRTFHTGGVAGVGGGDITAGLPRVVEIFEARNPKGAAELFDPADDQMSLYKSGGTVKLEALEGGRGTRVTLEPVKITKKNEEVEYFSIIVERGRRLLVQDGDVISIGHGLTEGPQNPGDILRLRGAYDVAVYLAGEVQKVYMAQGVEIHNKHIEVIVRQMLKKVRILTSGDTDWLPGELADGHIVTTANGLIGPKGEKATYEPLILGITKASLATDSFLSAASFQETTKVLTDASLEGKKDNLLGLKENVIIGKLIPAATGLQRYQKITFGPSERPRSFIEAEAFLRDLDLGTGIGGNDSVEMAVPNPDDSPFGF
jgi:DNA-directed RNA polymerase subunit beta'